MERTFPARPIPCCRLPAFERRMRAAIRSRLERCWNGPKCARALTINEAPKIIAPPLDQFVWLGGKATFTVLAEAPSR